MATIVRTWLVGPFAIMPAMWRFGADGIPEPVGCPLLADRGPASLHRSRRARVEDQHTLVSTDADSPGDSSPAICSAHTCSVFDTVGPLGGAVIPLVSTGLEPTHNAFLPASVEPIRMHPRAEAFASQAADEYGIEVTVKEFDEGTKTAEDAAAVVGCDVAQIASGLVFDADGDPVMVVTSGANRVSEDQLAAHLGAEGVDMADPDLVRAATGYGIGGVPPFCHEHCVPVLIDPKLLAFDEVWAAAGTPQAVFPIDPEELVAAANASPASVTE